MSLQVASSVTARQRIESISKELQTDMEDRQRRHEVFTKRLIHLAERHETLIASRIRRLSREGVILDIKDIREKIKTDKKERRDFGHERKSSVANNKNPNESIPTLRLELSFHSQKTNEDIKVEREKTEKQLESPKPRNRGDSSNPSRIAGKTCNFRRLSNKVINAQRFTSRRHTVLSVVPIDLAREATLHFDHNTDKAGKCFIHPACPFSCKDRQRSSDGIKLQEKTLVIDERTKSADYRNSRFRKAVRTLGVIRHIQKYL